MVTLLNEAAEDKQIIRDMALSGMEIARINLSHGIWVFWKKNGGDNPRGQGGDSAKHQNIHGFIRGNKDQKIEIHGKEQGQDGIPVQKESILFLQKKTNIRKEIFIWKTKNSFEKAEVGFAPWNNWRCKEGDVVLFDDGMIKSLVLSKKRRCWSGHYRLYKPDCLP